MNLYNTLKTGCLVLTIGFAFSAYAQNMGMTPLATSDKGGFQLTGNWKTSQTVTMHPEKSDFLKTTPATDNNTSILIGTLGSKATANLGTGDVVLQLDFMLAPASSAVIILPGSYEIQLNDSWRATKTNTNSCGSVGNLAPIQNACKAPGLWQSLRVQLRKLSKNTPAQIEKLILNGVVVQESAFLINKETTETKLSINVTSGTVAFKNVAYQLLTDARPLTLKNLSYTLYKAGNDRPDELLAQNILKKDTTSILTREWGLGNNSFYLLYEGQMDVTQEGDYNLQLAYMGNASFEIDGKTVLPYQWNDFLQSLVPTNIHLSKGAHPFKLYYHKMTWRRPALGLYASMQGIRPYALHVLSSVPEPRPIPQIEVSVGNKAELVRSFILHNGEKTKRTHCLSVGLPQGINYSLDLNRGSLLQFWKGPFADVTEMWHERGEPQILRPMGAANTTKGQADWAILSDMNTAWPDSLTDFSCRGYRLNTSGVPTATYITNGNDITDEINSENNKLTRIISGTIPNGYVRVVSGKSISALEKGLYEVNGQSYFVQIDAKSKPVLRSINGQEELLLPLNGTVRYSLIW